MVCFSEHKRWLNLCLILLLISSVLLGAASGVSARLKYDRDLPAVGGSDGDPWNWDSPNPGNTSQTVPIERAGSSWLDVWMTALSCIAYWWM